MNHIHRIIYAGRLLDSCLNEGRTCIFASYSFVFENLTNVFDLLQNRTNSIGNLQGSKFHAVVGFSNYFHPSKHL